MSPPLVKKLTPLIGVKAIILDATSGGQKTTALCEAQKAAAFTRSMVAPQITANNGVTVP
jgi:hypothetical protein